MSDDTRYTNELTLPSGGHLYEGALPDGKLRYGAIRGKEEKLLAGAKGNATAVIDSVLTSCVALPEGFTVGDLILNDRFFVLLQLRAESYGSRYKFPVQCGACNAKFPHEVNLPDDFDVKVLEDDSKEPFVVKLPKSGKEVGFRLLRGKDEAAITRFGDQAFAKGKVEGDPTYLYRIARHITEIDGEKIDQGRDMLKVVKFVENMHGMDSVTLRNAIDDADCGIDTTMNIECPKCEENIETSLPMTPEFFRPRS